MDYVVERIQEANKLAKAVFGESVVLAVDTISRGYISVYIMSGESDVDDEIASWNGGDENQIPDGIVGRHHPGNADASIMVALDDFLSKLRIVAKARIEVLREEKACAEGELARYRKGEEPIQRRITNLQDDLTLLTSLLEPA